jgi:MFS transporter, DHA2 family, multidrug resistance protein
MNAVDQAREVPWKPRHNPWAIAIVVTLAAFMEILDTTIVNVALPHIAGSLSASNDEATWVLTSYLVANGIVLTISGWLSAVIGRKRYFLICLSMFTVCSLLCGIANSLSQIIVFRLLQGFFGGGLQPGQQSIILDTFPPEKRGAAFGVTAIATVVAPVLGPLLGGFITDNYNWRWIFFINLPVGLIAVFFVSVLVEDPPWHTRISRRIDYIGLALITLGIGCLQVMMDRGEDLDWFGSPFIRIMAILAILGILGAIGWLLIAKNPIVDLDVFKDRNFAMGCVCIGATGAVLYAGAVVIPLFAQSIIGYNATWSGLVLSPGAIAVILLIPIVGQLMRVMQTRFIIAAGFFVMGCAFVYSSRLAVDIDFKTLVMMRSAQTGALAFLFVPIATITFATLPRELNGDATALFAVFRNVFGSIGVSVATAMITERTQIHQSYLARWASPFHQPFNEFIGEPMFAIY